MSYTFYVNVFFFFCLFSEKYLSICGYYFTCFTALLVVTSHIVWSSIFRKTHSHLFCFRDHTCGKSSQCYFVIEFWKESGIKTILYWCKFNAIHGSAAVHTKIRSFCDLSVLFHNSLVSFVNLLPQNLPKVSWKCPVLSQMNCVIYISIVKFLLSFGKKQLITSASLLCEGDNGNKLITTSHSV